jgi:hypothetical protein
MDDLSERLRRLGSAVADVSDLDAEQRESAASRARQAFVAGGTPAASARPAWRAPVLAAAACVAIAGLSLRWSPWATQKPHPLTFSVAADLPGLPPTDGVVGDWVAAGTAKPRAAHFSDGSDLSLSPGARMRVTTTRPEGADVLIEQGSVHVAVAHPNTPRPPGRSGPASFWERWSVRAGPFEVRVTGTTFDAAWDPNAERFELTMIEGRVLVTGPNLPPERAVVGGEHLVVSVKDGRMVLSSLGTEPASETPGAAAASTSEPVTPPPTASSGAVAKAPELGATGEAPKPPLPAAAAPWKDLAASGKYKDAFAAAEAAGFSAEVERGQAGDLLMLADAARYSGSPARAKEALLAARRRFSVRGQSAFLLGKIAADQQGSPGEAVTWFETYLHEQPGGPLAEQALGRIVDLTRRSNPAGARDAAARYLARYPEGSYAALARSLTASGL